MATGNVTRAVLRRFDLLTEVLGLDRQRAIGWTLGRVLQNALCGTSRMAILRLTRHRSPLPQPSCVVDHIPDCPHDCVVVSAFRHRQVDHRPADRRRRSSHLYVATRVPTRPGSRAAAARPRMQLLTG